MIDFPGVRYSCFNIIVSALLYVLFLQKIVIISISLPACTRARARLRPDNTCQCASPIWRKISAPTLLIQSGSSFPFREIRFCFVLSFLVMCHIVFLVFASLS